MIKKLKITYTQDEIVVEDELGNIMVIDKEEQIMINSSLHKTAFAVGMIYLDRSYRNPEFDIEYINESKEQ